MDLAAKGWISRPTPPSLPRPRAVPQFPHLPDGGKMPISCLMHFELIPPPPWEEPETPQGWGAHAGWGHPTCTPP